MKCFLRIGFTVHVVCQWKYCLITVNGQETALPLYTAINPSWELYLYGEMSNYNIAHHSAD